MNVDTGELRRIENLSNEELEQLYKDGFIVVPDKLTKEAMKVLADKESEFVDMKKKTKLTLWAERVKQGRNEICFCGSGLKYKKCCGT